MTIFFRFLVGVLDAFSFLKEMMDETKRKRLLDGIDLSGLKAVKEVNELSDLDDLSFNLSYYLDKKLNHSDKENVFNLLNRIKDKIGRLSIEFLRYILLTSDRCNHTTAIGILRTNYGKVLTKTKIRKIKKIIREFASELSIEASMMPTKEASIVKGNLTFTHRPRLTHFLNF